MSGEKPVIYLVRFSPQAAQDVAEAGIRLAEMTEDAETARSWLVGAYDEAGKLTLFPQANPIVQPESRLLGQEIRCLVYRRPGSDGGLSPVVCHQQWRRWAGGKNRPCPSWSAETDDAKRSPRYPAEPIISGAVMGYAILK